MFLKSALIRKNTSLIKESLIKLGYIIDNKYTTKGILTIPSLGLAIGVDNYSKIADMSKVEDCGVNDDLFISIAALRDDTDRDQWFVLDTNLSSVDNIDSFFRRKGEFIKCNRDKWFVDVDSDGNPSTFSSRNIPSHKATVDELRLFYNNGSLNILNYQDLIDSCKNIYGYVIDSNSNICNIKKSSFLKFDDSTRNITLSEKVAKSMLSMSMISQLLPYYGGEISNIEWKQGSLKKYIINRVGERIDCDISYLEYYFLAFHKEEQRDNFMKNNRHLIMDYFMLG